MADSIGNIQSNYEKYKDYFATDTSTGLDQNDFLTLMVEQLKNQDFNNPTDNTEFIAQMAQFSALQSQQQMTYYSQASYAASLVGKNVAVGYTDENGKYQTEEGIVSSMKFSGNDFLFVVNGYSYAASNIMEVKAASSSSATPVTSTQKVDLSLVDSIPALDSAPMINLSFTGTQEIPLTLKVISGEKDAVTAYTTEDGKAQLTVTLADADSITTTSALLSRINSAISNELLNPANAASSILTKENFTAGSLNIKVTSSGVLRSDGTNLTEADIAGINAAAVKTLLKLQSIAFS